MTIYSCFKPRASGAWRTSILSRISEGTSLVVNLENRIIKAMASLHISQVFALARKLVAEGD